MKRRITMTTVSRGVPGSIAILALTLAGCTGNSATERHMAGGATQTASPQSATLSLAAELRPPANRPLIGGVPTVASVINLSNEDTFSPTLGRVHPRLSAREAFDAEEHRLHPRSHDLTPAFLPGVQVRIGYFDGYQLTYALISPPSACLNTHNPAKTTATCVSWDFLSPINGELVASSGQDLPH